MKYLQKISILFLLAIAVACGGKKSSENTTDTLVKAQQVANLKTVTLAIEGMTCEIGCAKTIESKVAKIDGVVTSKVSFEAKEGVFAYDADQTNPEKITQTINTLLDGKTYAAHVVEGKTCKPGCEKKCTNKESASCKADCKMECCKDGVAKICKAETCKSCCVAKDAKTCESGAEKACCKTKDKESCTANDEKTCKPGCEKACCTKK